jgi:O-antigen/teichoic acid export membrane protein
MTEINLGKNILWAVISRFGIQVVGVISNLVLARYLGSLGFGEYAFITAVVLIGNALSTFGTDMVLIRKISSTQDYSDLTVALMLQLSISFIFIAVIFSLSSFLPAQNSLKIYIFSLIPLSFFTVFTIALRGAQYMGSFSLLHFFVAIFQLIAVFIVATLNAEIVQLAGLLLTIQFVAAFFGFVLCSRQLDGFRLDLNFDWNKMLLLLTSSRRMAIIGTLRLVYEKLAVTMLPLLTSISITGLFSASARVVDASKLGHMSALLAIFPEMAREYSSDGSFSTRMKRNYNLLFFAASLVSLILFLFAKPIIYILFGSEFTGSAHALQITAWTILPYFVVNYYSLGFVALQAEMPVLITSITSIVILAALLILWSPLYGLRGAASAVLCAEIFQAIFLWLQWRRYAFSK